MATIQADDRAIEAALRARLLPGIISDKETLAQEVATALGCYVNDVRYVLLALDISESQHGVALVFPPEEP